MQPSGASSRLLLLLGLTVSVVAGGARVVPTCARAGAGSPGAAVWTRCLPCAASASTCPEGCCAVQGARGVWSLCTNRDGSGNNSSSLRLGSCCIRVYVTTGNRSAVVALENSVERPETALSCTNITAMPATSSSAVAPQSVATPCGNICAVILEKPIQLSLLASAESMRNAMAQLTGRGSPCKYGVALPNYGQPFNTSPVACAKAQPLDTPSINGYPIIGYVFLFGSLAVNFFALCLALLLSKYRQTSTEAYRHSPTKKVIL